MVSLWPWKAADASPASFEKALSALTTKIAHTQVRLDSTRAKSRRVQVLCTLYMTFGYLVYAIVLVLVVGYRNMGAGEWSGVAGGPVLIYSTRTAVATFYNFRLDALASKLKALHNERADTIQKLKDATKYDSTLQLLQKYGGGSDVKSGRGRGSGGGSVDHGHSAKNSNNGSTPGRNNNNNNNNNNNVDGAADRPHSAHRVHLPPPPTANIQRRGSPTTTPSKQQAASSLAGGSPSPARTSATTTNNTDLGVTAEFAPNAYGAYEDMPQQSQPLQQQQPPPQLRLPGSTVGDSHWYDRILDLLMGDDETAARNRIVLICSACRLVNGQAPPGTRSLGEVGMWRCMGCGVTNGVNNGVTGVVGKDLRPSTPSVVVQSDYGSDAGGSEAPDANNGGGGDGGGDGGDGGDDENSVGAATGQDASDDKGARRRGKAK